MFLNACAFSFVVLLYSRSQYYKIVGLNPTVIYPLTGFPCKNLGVMVLMILALCFSFALLHLYIVVI